MIWHLTHTYLLSCSKCNERMIFFGWISICPECKYSFEVKERDHKKKESPRLDRFYSFNCTKCKVEMVFVPPKSPEDISRIHFDYKCPKCNHCIEISYNEEKYRY